jgi:hypothetical protein
LQTDQNDSAGASRNALIDTVCALCCEMKNNCARMYQKLPLTASARIGKRPFDFGFREIPRNSRKRGSLERSYVHRPFRKSIREIPKRRVLITRQNKVRFSQ